MGMGLWGIVFGDGSAQFTQFFPYRFFAFGQAQEVEQDGGPYYDVRRGHVFEVLHKFLRKSYFSNFGFERFEFIPCFCE